MPLSYEILRQYVKDKILRKITVHMTSAPGKLGAPRVIRCLFG